MTNLAEGWKLKRIEQLTKVVNGGTPKTSISDYWDGEKFWITPAEMGKLKIPYVGNTQRKLTQLGLSNSSASLVPKNSVILSTRAPIGHLAINTEPMAFNQGCRGMVPSDEIHYKYLYYFLLGNIKLLNDLGTGATFKELSSTKLKSVQLPYPSLNTQKRIVAILDEAFAGIDTAIANAQRNLANARELFESYLSLIFDPQKIGNKSESLNAWSLPRLKDICTKITDGVHKKPNYVESGVPFIKINNLTAGPGISFENLSFITQEDHELFCKRTHPEKGDILITKDGTIGVVRVIDTDIEFSIFVSVALIKPIDKTISNYLKYVLESPLIQSQINPQGAALKHLYLRDLREYTIPLAPEWERNEIVSKLDSVSMEVTRLEAIYQNKLNSLIELKRSLLQKAFSGELTANNIVSITSAAKPLTADSPAFSAHVMAAVYHWHESQGRNRTFGRVKAQKTLHLVESLAGIDMGRKPIKDAAGPNDSQHMRAAEDWSKANDFFEFVQRANGRGYDFKKLGQYDNLISNALEAIEPYKKALQKVVELLLPLNKEEAEILTTVYAAWNNLLLDGVEPTEEAIIYEARENWHPDKLRFTRNRFRQAIQTIRSHGIVPTGTGKRVVGQQSMF